MELKDWLDVYSAAPELLRKKLLPLIEKAFVSKNESYAMLKCIEKAYENNGKLSAVKLYREITEKSLIDAKHAVEHYALVHDWVKK